MFQLSVCLHEGFANGLHTARNTPRCLIRNVTRVILCVQLDGFVSRLPQGADIWRGVLYDVAPLICLDVHVLQRKSVVNN
jgi:hypothetical protein